MEPRRIITLKLLRETLSSLTPDIFKKLMQIYALPFNDAIVVFELYKKDAPTEMVASIWQDFQNALKNMSPKERENLRKECEQEINLTKP